MQYDEIINKGILIYKSQACDKKLREWRIEERTCSVLFYKTEPLSELDLVILRLLKSMEGEKITREDLGLILGFDVADRNYKSKRFYKDVAEVSLFNNMLDRVLKSRLIIEESIKCKIDENKESDSSGDSDENGYVLETKTPKYIRLTNLGQKALMMNCKFSFFSGEKTVLTNLNMSELPEDRDFFPFFSALGLYTEIVNVKPVDDYDADTIDINYEDDLIVRLNFQSNIATNIIKAKILNQRKNIAKEVEISLYKYNDQYYPIIFNNGSISVEATDVLYRHQNNNIRDKKVKKALYCKLINNSDSVINYNEIKLFNDAIEQEEYDLIIKDKRTDWCDNATYDYIVTNAFCTEKTWDIVSLYCPIDAIMMHINDNNSSFDMTTLSRRLPIGFIVENCTKFEWNINVVMSRDDITAALAQELMLRNTNSDIEWEIIEPYLDVDFVLSNMDKLNLDFYNLTAWLPVEHHSIICQYHNKNWNWQMVANDYDIKLIIDNIQILEDHVGIYIGVILDRICVDADLVNAIAQNKMFKLTIKDLNEKGNFISYNLSSKDYYAWNDILIDIFEQCGILKWNSFGSAAGFAKYSYVIWDSIFFEKYYGKISSSEDLSYVSEHISDLSLVSEHTEFQWDWKALSRNKNFFGLEKLLELGRDHISYEDWVINSGVELFPEFFGSHEHWMKRDENVIFASKSVKDYDVVIKHQSYPWNWAILAKNPFVVNDKRFCDSLNMHTEAIPNWIQSANSDIIEDYFGGLNLSKYIDRIANEQNQNEHFPLNNGIYANIWDNLSASLSPIFIYNNIREHWNYDIITKRFVSLIESSSDVLEKCKDLLNWKILSNELSELFITNHIDDYRNLWNWNTLSYRLSPVFVYQHLKIYFDYWDKGVVINRIVPLLKKDDIYAPEIEDWLDWHIISAKASEEMLFSILEDKKDFLSWDIISNRIANNIDCDFSDIITENKSVSDLLNWDILSSQMALSCVLKHRDLDNAKWDWKTITKRIDTAFILENIQKYSTYWDWDIILNEKFNREYITTNIRTVKDAISQLDPITRKNCWVTISTLYEPSELLQLSETINPLDGYDWDYYYIYTAISDPETFVSQDHSFVDWKAFSACDSVNRMFEYDSDVFVYRTWKRLVESKLNDSRFNWDYSELTKQTSIQERNDVFYEINSEKWDWDYISKYGTCLLPKHKGTYLRKYKERLNFALISTREDIDIDDKMIDDFSNETLMT